MPPLCVAVEWGVQRMARLIDAESPQNRIYVSDFVIEKMKKIPTVDIDRPTRSQFKRMAAQLGYEPVIHCRECKHYRNHPNGLCYAHTEPDDNERGYKGEAVCVEPEDFCSYGERKNDFVDDNKIGERRDDER